MADFKPFLLSDAIGAGQNLAMNQFRLNEGVRQVQSRDALTSALQEGTPEAMTQYRQKYPVESMQFNAQQRQESISQLQLASGRADFLGRLASGVTDEASYQNALKQAKEAGIDVAGSPPNYDPNYIKQVMEQSMTIKQRADAAIKQSELVIKRDKNKETERHNRAMEGIAATRANKESTGGDRSSPNHMNAVRRSAADSLGLQADTTGRLMADVAPENLKKHNALSAVAQRIYVNNPGTTPAEAVEQAKQRIEGGPKQVPQNPAERTKGTVYQTPKGPMTWTGTGWLPAN